MKKNSSLLILLTLFISFLFTATSCSLHIEKRRYRKGYHVNLSYHHKNTPHQPTFQTPKQPEVNQSTSIIGNKTVELKDSLVKTAIKPHQKQKPIIHQAKPKHPKKITQKRSDHCDIITFTDGRQEEVIIEEITETEIKYKKCSFREGPSYRISKSKIKKIDMYNGEVYMPQTTTPSNGKITGVTATSLIMAILAFIFLIVGIVLVFTTGGGFSGWFLSSAGLAPAGTFSLIGLIMGATQWKKKAHPLAKAVFIINLIIQILAIIFTILMFIV